MIVEAIVALAITIIGGIVTVAATAGRRRRAAAVRKALHSTSGKTSALRTAVRGLSNELLPSAHSAEDLGDALCAAMGPSADRVLVDRFLSHLHRELGDGGLAMSWAPPAPRIELPRLDWTPPTSALVGRARELERLLQLVRATTDCLITGPPGIGKTRLLEAVRDAINVPVAFVRLEQGGEPMRDIRLALHRFSRGTFPADDDEGLAMLQRSVPPGVVLLVDNADSPSSARAVQRVAIHLPNLRFVVTSRGAALEAFEVLVLEPLSYDDSERLLVERGFTGTAEVRAEVVRQGDGNPLLIQQAAWAATRGPTSLLDPSLDRMKLLLDEVRAVAPDLVRVIGDLPSTYHPIACLSAFTAEGTVYDALTRNAVMRPLGELVVFHETLRQTSRNIVRLMSAETIDRMRRQSLSLYLRWLREVPDFEAVDLVLPNLLHLLRVAADDEVRLDVADALCGDNYDDPNGYLAARGFGSVLLELCPQLHGAANRSRNASAARVLKNLGIFAYWTDSPLAEDLLYEARALFEELGDRSGMAACTWMLGAIADDGSRYGDAEALYRQPLSWHLEARAQAISHHMVGCSLYHQGRLEEARKEFSRAAALIDVSDVEIRSRLDRRLAYLELAEGRIESALDSLLNARGSAERLGRPRNVARIARHIGEAHLLRMEYGDARRALEEAQHIFEDAGDNRGLGGTLRVLGRLEGALGRFEHAEVLLRRSVTLALGRRTTDSAQPARSVFGVAAGEEELARLHLAQGHADEAARHLRAATNAFESIGHPRRDQVITQFDYERNEPVPVPVAMVFDLIDTIAVRDREKWQQAEVELANELGIDLDLLRAVWRRSSRRASTEIAWSTEARIEWVAANVGHKLSTSSVARLAERQRRLWVDAVRLRPSALECMRALRAAGIRLAVLTNGSVSMEGVFANLGISDMAEGLLSCQIGIVKPEAGAYRAALDAVHASPQDCIYVGNGEDFELEGAISIGMFAVRLGTKGGYYEVGESFCWHAQFQELSDLVAACTKA